MPPLENSSAEAIDGRTLRHLLWQNMARQKEEEARRHEREDEELDDKLEARVVGHRR